MHNSQDYDPEMEEMEEGSDSSNQNLNQGRGQNSGSLSGEMDSDSNVEFTPDPELQQELIDPNTDESEVDTQDITDTDGEDMEEIESDDVILDDEGETDSSIYNGGIGGGSNPNSMRNSGSSSTGNLG